MYDPTELKKIMNAFTAECKMLFGAKLLDVRLYGSYARGDQDSYSDIDLMILVDMNDDEASKYLFYVCGIASDISLEHDGIDLSPHICCKNLYEKMRNFPGFYNNVMREGISVYVG